jgi:hypothetical protein
MNYKEILEKMDELGINKRIFASDNEDGDYDDYDDGESDEEYGKVSDIIKEQFTAYHRQTNARYRSAYLNENNEITVEGLGRIKVVEQKGGYNELQDGATGMEWYIVRHFVDHDIYIRLNGHYTSYEGLYTRNSKYKHVKPIERVIVDYV